jgi:lipooligosaccharide transport system permease protein
VTPALAWQSRAVLGRHVRVHLRKWHIALLPPVADPVVLLLAFGVGLGSQMPGIAWSGRMVDYLTWLGPGVLAYTVFMTSFFQSLFSAYVRMVFQKSWEGQLTTQVRMEHVVWGEAYWAAGLATTYAGAVCAILGVFGLCGAIDLHWAWMPAAIPILFLAALAFACIGLLCTALLPSMDHMGLPFFLVIMPIGFASSTYFPLPAHPAVDAIAALNPLHHLAIGLRHLLIDGQPTMHLLVASGICAGLIAVLMPIDLRLLRRRVFGDA